MNLREHLSSTQLKAYLQGWLDETSSDSIEQHLSECPECEETLVSLENDCDTLVQHLRNAEQHEPPKAPPRMGLIAESQLPHRFGAYELQKRIGQGGMGSVYQARHVQLNKSFAIKLVQVPERAGNASRARFEREVRAAGGLNHSAIVCATDAGQQDQIHFLAMELIEGHDLGKIARSTESIRVADACEVIRVVADGLNHAHASGVVHRDIKPSNVMLSRSGDVKVLDFGLAQLSKWDDVGVELTTVGQLMGTLDYMAPEQAEHPEAVDYRADLYSLGATLFRLLCGRPPLSATPNLSPLAKLRLLANHSPPRADTLRPDLPAGLVNLIASLLASDPNDRPASASHVAEQLAPFCEGHDLVALASRRITESVDPVDDRPTNAHQESDQWLANSSPPRPPINWRWLAAAALPLLVIAGIVISVQFQKGQLIIESEAAVTVSVNQDGKTYDKVKIHPGNNQTKLYAGTYEIIIDDASDSFSLDKDTIQIERGDVVIARIKSKPQKIDKPSRVVEQRRPIASSSSGLPSSSDPLKPGDRIRFVCDTDDELSGATIVLADDSIKVRKLGVISTKGKTVVELEQTLNDAYGNYRERVYGQQHIGTAYFEVFRDVSEITFEPREGVRSPAENALFALKMEYEMKRSEFGPSHPSVRSLEKKIAMTQEMLGLRQVAAEQPPSNEPLYDGKPFSQWLQLLKLERSPDGIEKAIEAVWMMGGKENATEISRVVLDKLDRLAEMHADDVAALSPNYFALLERLNPSQAYPTLLLHRLEEGNPAIRKQVLRYGLKARRFDENSKRDFVEVRKWIESEVFQGDAGQELVGICGTLFLRWYGESGSTEDELIETLAANPNLSHAFWVMALSNYYPPSPLVAECSMKKVESTLMEPASSDQAFVAATGLYHQIAGSHANQFPEFDDRDAVLKQLSKRLQRSIDGDSIHYEIVKPEYYPRNASAVVTNSSSRSRHWSQARIHFPSTVNLNNSQVIVFYELLEFIALLGGELVVQPQLEEIVERSQPGYDRVREYYEENSLGSLVLIWPSMQPERKSLQKKGITLSDFPSADCYDVFAFERATRMLEKVAKDKADQPEGK